MTYKLLATDMDGTLLLDNKDISPASKEALKRARQRGVEIVLCTGRHYVTVEPYLGQLGIDCWIVTNNGGVIRNKEGEIISITYMKPKALAQAIDILLASNVDFNISDERYIYIQTYRERIRNIRRFLINTGMGQLAALWKSLRAVFLTGNHKKVNFNDFVEGGGKAVSIFIISQDLEKLKKLSDKLQDLRDVDITSSNADNIEILDQNATKGKALEYIGKLISLDREEIIAVGDNYNDVSMIDYAGLGVAMDNAEKGVIARADWVTKSNENEGIAHLIKKFIVGPKPGSKELGYGD